MEIGSMSKRSHRSTEKESFWRSQLSRQLSSGESIRGYCLHRGLSEASFHFWRRAIAGRDRDASRTTGSGSAGLIAVEIVDGASPRPAAQAAISFECPGGTFTRVRDG